MLSEGGDWRHSGKPLKRTLCNFSSGTGSDTKIEVAALSPCGTSKCQQGLNAHTHTPTRTPTHLQSPRPLQDLLGPGTGKEEPQWPRPPPAPLRAWTLSLWPIWAMRMSITPDSNSHQVSVWEDPSMKHGKECANVIHAVHRLSM